MLLLVISMSTGYHAYFQFGKTVREKKLEKSHGLVVPSSRGSRFSKTWHVRDSFQVTRRLRCIVALPAWPRPFLKPLGAAYFLVQHQQVCQAK